jgi:membrane protease YdiL (CAAX protease family)
VVEAAAASAGMVLFALFVRSGLPLVILSGVGLMGTALAVANTFRAERRPAAVLGFSPLSGKTGVFVALGCAVGVGFGVLHRVTWEMGATPARLAPFAFVGACIGAAEELVYRGYVQGRLRAFGWVVPVVVAALAHTAYKTALFAFPPDGVAIDLRYLAVWTFVGGVVFGVLRQASGSVLPPLAAHVVFDIIVYGENVQAPWWVWS